MKKCIIVVAAFGLSACATDQAPVYGSDNRVVQLGSGTPAGRLGTLNGYVLRVSGSPLCDDPVIEGRTIRCSISDITGPDYDFRSAGPLTGFTVQDGQRREICINPRLEFSGGRAFIDC
ncbi:hypothetical protein [Aurantiacibacter sediminis]|uniref:Lipoprotein n=1 Tax=Aurantiacibacter sediminis TaxID=2793064 RepID=A0ABS0N5A7_9SPHN|nr:hypothetical protein [Aurantiacibacter sediminis]MBH5322962.1 hypothetical protein [Aurantiacibacter sediminis]